MAGGVKGVYWLAGSGFPVDKIESKLYTHIFCGFANIDPTTSHLVILPEYEKSFSNFSSTVKHKNRDVKTLISIEGPIQKGHISPFRVMTSDEDARKSFISSSIDLARKYHFDGLDLDWEYPKSELEMKNFGKLLDEWRPQVNYDAVKRKMKPLLLTATVSFGPTLPGATADKFISYPYKSISENLDWINAKTYDFYSPITDKTETRAPSALYSSTSTSNTNVVNVDDAIKAWIKAGVKSSKLVLGIPFYGHGWKLKDHDHHGLLAPADGPAPGTDADGTIEYNQIRIFIEENHASTVYLADVVTDYCYAGTKWIAYDGIQTVQTKVTYAKTNDLGGYFAWHVGADNNDRDLSKTATNAWNGNN